MQLLIDFMWSRGQESLLLVAQIGQILLPDQWPITLQTICSANTPSLQFSPFPCAPFHPSSPPNPRPGHKVHHTAQRQSLRQPQQRPRPIRVRRAKAWGHLPERLVPVDAPKVKGLVVYGAKLKGTGTRYFAAWTEWGGTFIGWMRTRPKLAGDTPDAVHAIGEVLGIAVFSPEESSTCALYDALELFRLALREAAQDMGLS